MGLNALTQGEKLVLVGGVLLLIDLLLLPWHSVDLGGLDLVFDATRTGVQSPNGGYGVAAVILTLVMVAQIVASKVLSMKLPELPLPWSQVHLVLGIFVAVVLVIKLIKETDFLGYGAYSGILAALLVAYGAYSINQESARSG